MKVYLDKDAAKYIERLEESDKRRVLDKLKTLESNPYSGKKLKRRKNTYSLRVGDYRIIYEIHKDIREIWILKVIKEARFTIGFDYV